MDSLAIIARMKVLYLQDQYTSADAKELRKLNAQLTDEQRAAFDREMAEYVYQIDFA